MKNPRTKFVTCFTHAIAYHLLSFSVLLQIQAANKRQTAKYNVNICEESTRYSIKIKEAALYLMSKSNTGLLRYTPSL